jgi:hypothetical protein
MVGCKHNIERKIEYWATGSAPRVFNPVLHVYERWLKRMQPHDYMVLRCPHGCKPIIVSCQDKGGEI